MSDDTTTQIRVAGICGVHSELSAKVERNYAMLWRMRTWMIYLGFICILSSFFGSYAGAQWPLLKAIVSAENSDLEGDNEQLTEEQDHPIKEPLVAGRN